MAEMAEMVVSAQVDGLLEKIDTPLLKGVWLFFGVYDYMKKLQRTLWTIRCVLQDAQRKSAHDEQVRDWLKKVKSAAFEADDVVDEFEIEQLRRTALRQSATLDAKVREFFSPHNSIVFRYKMARKIKHVTKRLDEVAEEGKRYKFVEGSTSEKNLSIYRETHSFVMESYICGRDKDKRKVLDFLVNTDNDKNVSILPIVGLGGVGKTTLARLIYNHPISCNHFDMCAWVSVYQKFDVTSITKNILESITRDKVKLVDFESIQQQLHWQLRGKRFLVVLDDVWSENLEQWEVLEYVFRSGRNGSKVLVTTRSVEVATIIGTQDYYRLEGLSPADCWAMYKVSDFTLRTEEETPRMVNIAKEIFTKCGGLPIVVKALGHLLNSRRDVEGWLSIKYNLELHDEYINSILPVLKLSYDNLPSHVKQCFLYCSLFPKDSILDKERLIKLWIAEGLIPSSDKNEGANPENFCNTYLNILSHVSFFQVGKTDYSGNIVSYKMLDIVHDVACSVAGYESCIVKAGSERDVSLGCRYMSVVTDNVYKGLTIPKEDYKSVKLRTFLTSKSYFGGIVRVDWGRMSTSLRVLDLSFTSIEKLPDSLDILKHLRLLDLSWTEIRTIPDSIISLQKLQTLYLINCYQLQQLPEGIVFLNSLSHLDISGCYKLTCMPRGIGRLTILRTLPTFIVGKERGRTIMELEHLNQIRGKLQIDGLHCVKDVNEAVQAKLAEKTELESLDLRWAWSASSSSSGDNTNKQENSFLAYMKKISFPRSKGSIPAEEEDVLERLRPPNKLKELRIIRYAGTKFPSWMTTTPPLLPSLVTIVLFDIKRCECLPLLGHLPSLRLLSLYCMPDLVEWSTELISTGSGVESIYPRLERLLITNCPKLAGLPERLFNLTALWDLQIERCPLLGTQSWRKTDRVWHNTIKIDDLEAQKAEKSSSREEIEEELQE